MKKAGGPDLALRLGDLAALPPMINLRRAQISRVRGADGRAHPQLESCGADEADVRHLAG
jgi:hypothetical protein